MWLPWSHGDIVQVEQLSLYGYQIASGMAYIHSKQILHRALAARNILVVNENHVVISDFMLSRVRAPRPPNNLIMPPGPLIMPQNP